jgi:hypothetical protein
LLYSSWAALRADYWPAPSSSSEIGRLDDDHDALSPPKHDPEFAKAWLVTEELLVKLASEIAERGAEPWMVTGTISDQVVPDVRRRRALEQALQVNDLYYPEHRIDDVFAARRIAAINLAQPFADYAAAHKVFLHGPEEGRSADGNGHWNERAHRLAGEIVSDRLCEASDRLRRVKEKTWPQSDR